LQPVFAGVIPTVSTYYLEVSEPGSGTFVIEVLEEGVIYMSPRAERLLGVIREGDKPTGYDAHSIDFPDAEVLFDARAVTRVDEIPALVIQELNKIWEETKEKHITRGFLPHTWKTKDPELVAAKIRAIANLDLMVPMTLERPFIEAPLPPEAFEVMEGDRVLLVNGTIGKVTDYRDHGEEGDPYQPEVQRFSFSLRGVKGPLPYTQAMIDERVALMTQKAERDGYVSIRLSRKRWGRIFEEVPPTPENIYKAAMDNLLEYLGDRIADAFIVRKLERGERITKRMREELAAQWLAQGGLQSG
jgi:hypothetical protein